MSQASPYDSIGVTDNEVGMAQGTGLKAHGDHI